MGHAVVELGEFAGVPSVGGAYEIPCDALYGLESHAALRAFRLLSVGVLIAASGAVVAVMVDASVADVVSVHKVYDLCDSLFIVGGIAVDFHIEDVSAARQVVIWGLNAGLVAGRAVIVYGHMVGVGVVVLVGHSRDYAESLAVAFGESSSPSAGVARME